MGGTRRPPRRTEPLHQLPFARKVQVRAVGAGQSPGEAVVPVDERPAPVPNHETGAVDRGIREAPEGIGLVGQKVRRDEGIVIGPDGMAAEHTYR